MPELPEVESLKQSLAPLLAGRTIVTAELAARRLRADVAPDLATQLAGRKILELRRRGKYLIVELSGQRALIIHLGMTGSLTCRRGLAGESSLRLNPGHDHLRLSLDNGSVLVYNDPRRFGLLRLVPCSELSAVPELRALGPEPLNGELSADYLRAVFRGRRAAVKTLLMDQSIVAGIGNIYAAEILFHAGLRPTRRAGRLTRAEINQLVEVTPEVLKAAIGKGGTTFRNYLDARGEPGRFRERLFVYGRAGERCRVCTTTLRAVRLGQRATVYCPRCQK